jgi:hypothetical protein
MLHRLVLAVPLVGWLGCSLGFDGDGLQTGPASSVASTGAGGEAGSHASGAGGDASCTCMDVPRGWQGPVLLRQAANGDPQCGAGENIIAEGGLGDFAAAKAECDVCTCDTPNDPCKLALYLYDDTACMQYVIDFLGPACNTDPIGFVGSISATGIFNNMTSCAASGGETTLPPVQWAERATVCSFVEEEGCKPGQVCAGSSTALARTCIFQRGADSQCPAGFDEALSFSEVQSDTRACGMCACGPVGGTLCSAGTVVYYDMDNCIGQALGSDSLGGCFSPLTQAPIESAKIIPAVPGSCVPSGGAPVGDVTFAEQTYCCVPAN